MKGTKLYFIIFIIIVCIIVSITDYTKLRIHCGEYTLQKIFSSQSDTNDYKVISGEKYKDQIFKFKNTDTLIIGENKYTYHIIERDNKKEISITYPDGETSKSYYNNRDITKSDNYLLNMKYDSLFIESIIEAYNNKKPILINSRNKIKSSKIIGSFITLCFGIYFLFSRVPEKDGGFRFARYFKKIDYSTFSFVARKIIGIFLCSSSIIYLLLLLYHSGVF